MGKGVTKKKKESKYNQDKKDHVYASHLDVSRWISMKDHAMRLNVSSPNRFSTWQLFFSHSPAASIRIGWAVPAAATEPPRCSRRIHQILHRSSGHPHAPPPPPPTSTRRLSPRILLILPSLALHISAKHPPASRSAVLYPITRRSVKRKQRSRFLHACYLTRVVRGGRRRHERHGQEA